jgi:hypothetical protein
MKNQTHRPFTLFPWPFPLPFRKQPEVYNDSEPRSCRSGCGVAKVERGPVLNRNGIRLIPPMNSASSRGRK